MGLGKTFVGSEKMKELHTKVNLVICQKSKVNDWVEHFKDNYNNITVYDCTQFKKDSWERFAKQCNNKDIIEIFVINYELAF